MAIRPTTTSTTTTDAAPTPLSSKVQRIVDTLRPSFDAYTRDYTALAVRREELAPKFMKAFGAWQTETGGTFVQFVRLFDATIGESREEYRAHRSYQAADYLRRLAGRQTRAPESSTERATRIASTPVRPMQGFARVLAAVVPLVQPEALSALWKAVESELHWSPEQVARLQTLVTEATPLIRMAPTRGATITPMRVTVVHEAQKAA